MFNDWNSLKCKNRIAYLVAALPILLLASCSGPSSTEPSRADSQTVSELEQNVVVQEELIKQSIRIKDYGKLARLLVGPIKDDAQAIVRIRGAAQEDLVALRIVCELLPGAKHLQGESPYLIMALKRGKWDIAAFLWEQGERCDASLFREKFDRAPTINIVDFLAILPVFDSELSEKDWEDLWERNIHVHDSKHIQGWVDHFVKQPNELPCRALARVLASFLNTRMINVSRIPLSIFSTFEHDAKVALANKLIQNRVGSTSPRFSGFLEDFLDDTLELDQQQFSQLEFHWPEQFERMHLAEPTRWSNAFHESMQQRGDFSRLEPWKGRMAELASKPMVKHYHNQTPLDVAMNLKRYDLVQWMVDHGAVNSSKTQNYTGTAALVANIEFGAFNPLNSDNYFYDTAYNPLIRAADRHGAELVARVSKILQDSPVTQSIRTQAVEAFFKAGRFDMLHAVLESSELHSSILLDYLSRDKATEFLRSIPPNSAASHSLKNSLPEVLKHVCTDKSAVTIDLVFESLWRCARVEHKQLKVASLEDLLRAVDDPPARNGRSRKPSVEKTAIQSRNTALVDRLSQLLNDYVDRPEIFKTLIWEGIPVTTDTFKKVIEARKLDVAKLILMDLNWRKQNAGFLRETLLTALEKRDTPIIELFKVAGMEHMLTDSQLASISSHLGGS